MSTDHSYLRQLGETPWRPEELAAALEHIGKLHHTPRDDWDRAPRRFSFGDPEHGATSFQLNPDLLDTQMGLWLTARMRGQGLSLHEQHCHLWRFLEVRQFIADNIAALRADGLVVDDPSDNSAIAIEESVLAVLAVVPYEGVRLQAGDPIPTFGKRSQGACAAHDDHGEAGTDHGTRLPV